MENSYKYKKMILLLYSRLVIVRNKHHNQAPKFSTSSLFMVDFRHQRLCLWPFYLYWWCFTLVSDKKLLARGKRREKEKNATFQKSK